MRIAHLPYDDDVLSGTLAAWYAGGGEPPTTRSSKRSTSQGRRPASSGRGTRTARPRANSATTVALLVEARAYSETGKALPEAEARALAARDLATTTRSYRVARCDRPRASAALRAGGDRLEKG